MVKDSNVVVDKKPFQRLPSVVTPKHYVVRLKPDLKALSFVGSVEVELQVNDEHVTQVVCNAAELEVNNAEVDGVAVNDVRLKRR